MEKDAKSKNVWKEFNKKRVSKQVGSEINLVKKTRAEIEESNPRSTQKNSKVF